jgi:hypothetical protein
MSYTDYDVSFETKKWGVIDSLGNIIVPFICDGVKEISENNGIISVFLSCIPLYIGHNSSYKYQGTTYSINKEGIINDTDEKFEIRLWGTNAPLRVIKYGHMFYLPNPNAMMLD